MGSDGSGCLWIGEKVRGVSCNELAQWRWDPGLQLNSSHPKNLQKGLGGRAVFPPQKLRSPTRQGVAASPQTGVLAEHSGCLRRGQSRDRCVCVWGAGTPGRRCGNGNTGGDVVLGWPAGSAFRGTLESSTAMSEGQPRGLFHEPCAQATSRKGQVPCAAP